MDRFGFHRFGDAWGCDVDRREQCDGWIHARNARPNPCILGDIVVRSHAAAGIPDPQLYEQAIRNKLGDRLAGTTTVVAVPAMLTYSVAGQSHTQKIDLIGIDSETYSTVSDFSGFLMHPENQKKLEFGLHEAGYAPDRPGLKHSGWRYRRDMARARKELEAEQERNRCFANRSSKCRLPKVHHPLLRKRLHRTSILLQPLPCKLSKPRSIDSILP